MANNRMQFYCKKCLEAISIAKFYPPTWSFGEDIGKRLNEFLDDHNARCHPLERQTTEQYTQGLNIYNIRTENDEDGYFTAFEPYRIFKNNNEN